MSTQALARAKTGIAGLDEILHGGLIPARLYLVDGNPGAGKTTLALQFLQEGVRAGERCLYVTLSETAEELKAGAHSHEWSLAGIEIVELIADESEFDGESQLTMFHPSEIDLTETTRMVLEAIQRVNPRRLVFDSLSELRLLAQSSLRYRRQILAFKQFLVGRDCTVLSTATFIPRGRAASEAHCHPERAPPGPRTSRATGSCATRRRDGAMDHRIRTAPCALPRA